MQIHEMTGLYAATMHG